MGNSILPRPGEVVGVLPSVGLRLAGTRGKIVSGTGGCRSGLTSFRFSGLMLLRSVVASGNTIGYEYSYNVTLDSHLTY